MAEASSSSPLWRSFVLCSYQYDPPNRGRWLILVNLGWGRNVRCIFFRMRSKSVAHPGGNRNECVDGQNSIRIACAWPDATSCSVTKVNGHFSTQGGVCILQIPTLGKRLKNEWSPVGIQGGSVFRITSVLEAITPAFMSPILDVVRRGPVVAVYFIPGSFLKLASQHPAVFSLPRPYYSSLCQPFPNSSQFHIIITFQVIERVRLGRRRNGETYQNFIGTWIKIPLDFVVIVVADIVFKW